LPQHIQNKFNGNTDDQCIKSCGHLGATDEKCKSRIQYTLDGEHYRRCIGHYFSFGELNTELIPAYWRLLELDYGLKKM
jgi:hypothetical protein